MSSPIENIKEAVKVRKIINGFYAKYRALSKIAQVTALIDHHDFKRAVDAVYYLGGGWPSANSRGRMEAAIENMVGMYKVLTLAGKGYMVEKHFAKFGVKIELTEKIQDTDLSAADIALLRREYELSSFEIDDKQASKLSTLVSALIEEAYHLQRDICQHADIIKHSLKPAAKNALGIMDEEYDRLFIQAKFNESGKPDKAQSKRAETSNSITSYNKIASRV